MLSCQPCIIVLRWLLSASQTHSLFLLHLRFLASLPCLTLRLLHRVIVALSIFFSPLLSAPVTLHYLHIFLFFFSIVSSILVTPINITSTVFYLTSFIPFFPLFLLAVFQVLIHSGNFIYTPSILSVQLFFLSSLLPFHPVCFLAFTHTAISFKFSPSSESLYKLHPISLFPRPFPVNLTYVYLSFPSKSFFTAGVDGRGLHNTVLLILLTASHGR